MILQAQQQKFAQYIQDGLNIWSTVHVDDLAEAYRLALEKAPPGTLLNLGAGEVTMRALNEAIARLIGAPDATQSLSLETARQVMPFADGIALSERVNSDRARALLGWQPSKLDILHDIEYGSYRQLLAS